MNIQDVERDIPWLGKEQCSFNQDFSLATFPTSQASSAKAMFDFPKSTCSSRLTQGQAGGSGLRGTVQRLS